MYYPAVFLPHSVDGNQVYDVIFPDVPGCYSQGAKLEQALENAAEALHCHLGMDVPVTWPAAGTLEQIKARAYAEAEQDGMSLPEGTHFMLVKVPEAAYQRKQPESVRLSISLRPNIVAQVDAAARDMGITRSGFVALATRLYIKTLES